MSWNLPFKMLLLVLILSIVHAERSPDPAFEEKSRLLQTDADKRIEQGLLFVGTVALQNRNFEEAKRYFKQVIEINPKNEGAYLLLGFAYYSLQDYEEARRNFARVFELNPKNPSAYNNFALALMQENNYLQAMESVVTSTRE